MQTNIKFKKLELKNFKSHTDSEMDFSDNKFVLVTGENGAGKTTFIDAICWALYDKTTNGIKGDNVITKKVGKNCSVKLTFKINDDEYTIENYRKDKVHKSNKYLFKKGVEKPLSGDTKAETNKIIESLILPEKIFFNCLLFSQLAKKNFSDMEHSEQKEILDKILCLEKYDEYYNIVKEKSDEKNNLLSELSSNIKMEENNKEFIENDIEYNNEKITEIETAYNISIKEDNKNIENETKAINKYKNVYSTANHKQCEKDFNEASLERNNIENKISNLFEEINTIESKFNEEIKSDYDSYIESIYSKYKEIENNHLNEQNKVREEYNKVRDKLTEEKSKKYNKILDEVKKEINELQKNYKKANDKLKVELKNINDNIETNNTEYNIINNKLIRYKDKLKELENTKEVCEYCGQNIQEESLNKVRTNIKKLSDLIQKETDNLKKYETEELKKSQKIIEDRLDLYENKYEEKLENLNTKYTNIFNTWQTLDLSEMPGYEEYSELDNKLTKYCKEHTEIKNKRDSEINSVDFEEFKTKKKGELNNKVNEIKNNIETLESEHATIQKKVVELNVKLEEYNSIKETLLEHKNNINTIQEGMKRTKKSYDDNMKMFKDKIKSLNEKITACDKKILEYNSNITNIKEDLEILKFWKTAFSNTGIKSILLDDALPILNGHSTELSKLTENIRVRFNSQTALATGNLNNKFSIDVIQTKNLSEFKELSSGEKRMANLIISLSLRKLLETMYDKSINILLFDELLDALSETHAIVAVDMIKQLSNQYYVMLISHIHKHWIDADEIISL